MSGISRWRHERSDCTPVALHPFVMHWKGSNLAVPAALLAGTFLTALALTGTLARRSAFTFATASTIARPFRPSRGAFAISPRHPDHLLSQKCTYSKSLMGWMGCGFLVTMWTMRLPTIIFMVTSMKVVFLCYCVSGCFAPDT